MLVTRTGAGKSHVFRVLCTLLRYVHLVAHPLLALTTDQARKFRSGNKSFGAISATNLDGHDPASAEHAEILALLTNLERSTSTTVYLFASPLRLARNQLLRQTLLACAHKGT